MHSGKNIADDAAYRRRRGLFDPAYILLIAAILIAGFYIIKLTRQNALLQSSISESSGTLCGPQSAQRGDLLPAFKTVNTAGHSADVGYGGTKRSLLFIFSPACDVCANEIPIWNKIADKAASRHFAVHAISLDSLEDTKRNLPDKDLRFEVLIMPNMPTRRALRVVSIPQIMVVSPNGAVDWVHYGALEDDKTAELLSLIDAKPDWAK